MTQRRSLEEVRENIEYLANLPRVTSLKIQNIDVNEPEQDGLIYHYRAIIHYVPKKDEKSERIKKDEDIIVMRIRRACEHKRWGRTPWSITDSPSLNSHSAPPIVHENMPIDEEAHMSTQRVPNICPTATSDLPDNDSVKDATEKFNMVSDATRLKIILLLKQRERNVTELCEDLQSQSQPAISHHLSLLRHARLVEQHREGKHNFYDLTDVGRGLADLISPFFA